MKKVLMLIFILFMLLIFCYGMRLNHSQNVSEVINYIEQIEIYNTMYPRNGLISIPVYYISKNNDEWIMKQLKRNVQRFQRIETDQKEAIYTAYKNGEDLAIIMTDQMYIDMTNIIDFSIEEMIEKMPNDWDILELSKSNENFAYIINRKGMEKMLSLKDVKRYSYPIMIPKYDNDSSIDLSLEILHKYNSKLLSATRKKQLKGMISNLALHNEKVGFRCDIPCPVYYINMDKDVDRRTFMERQIEKMPNVHFTRISGFNGYAIRNKKNDRIRYNDSFINFVNKFDEMTNSEIGCTLSHLIAIKQAYTNGDEIAMICEDDILFDTCTLIKPIQEMIDEAPKNWEILQLCSFTEKEVHEQSKNHPEIDYIRNNGKNRHYNTACYLINRNGMENILRFSSTDNFFIINKKLDFPSSGTADLYIYEICVTYTVLPVPFTVDNTYNDSTIHTDHTDYHIISSINTLSKFKIINFPKVIYICDKTFEFIEKYSQNWKRLNPEYEIVLFDNKACEEFLETEFSSLHLEIFRYIPDGSIKAGFWRLCILYKNGGVYTDADNEPLVPLSDFIEDVDFVTCGSYGDKYKFNPNFIVAKAGDKILEDSINLYIHWYKTKPYNYLDWSIRQVFTEIIKVYNGKIQIIKEVKGKDYDHNTYKGKRVFQGRLKVNHTVWQYWEKDKNIPGYISYCMNRVKNQANKDGMNYILITPENLNQYIPSNDLPKYFYDLKEIAHRADFVRIYILYYYGGMWIDADGFVKGSFIPLFNDLYKNEIVYWDSESKNEAIENSLLLARSRSTGMKIWYNKIINILNTKKDIEWTEIGGTIFRNILNNLNNNKVYNLSETCFPIHWSDSKLFFEKGNSDFLIRENQPIVMLYNHIFPKEFKSLNEQEFNEWLITSDTVLADLMRKY